MMLPSPPHCENGADLDFSMPEKWAVTVSRWTPYDERLEKNIVGGFTNYKISMLFLVSAMA